MDLHRAIKGLREEKKKVEQVSLRSKSCSVPPASSSRACESRREAPRTQGHESRGEAGSFGTDEEALGPSVDDFAGAC
jgi:hypothetical protein